jgi:hypothetical protein
LKKRKKEEEEEAVQIAQISLSHLPPRKVEPQISEMVYAATFYRRRASLEPTHYLRRRRVGFMRSII